MKPNNKPLNTDCDRFQERMHSLLDQRVDLKDDDELNLHSDQCEECREILHCWSQVDQLVLRPAAESNESRAEPSRTTIGVGTRFAISIAASLMLIMTVGRFVVRSSQSGDRIAMSTEFDDSLSSGVPERAAGNQDSFRNTVTRTRAGGGDWNSGTLWNAVADDQWVRQTLPAVNSVGRGVAPIGRSMRQAFVLLLIQGQGGSIQPSSTAPSLPQQSFDEQTSRIESFRVYLTMV